MLPPSPLETSPTPALGLVEPRHVGCLVGEDSKDLPLVVHGGVSTRGRMPTGSIGWLVSRLLSLGILNLKYEVFLSGIVA